MHIPYNLLTCFKVVKTASLNLYKPSTTCVVDKTGLCKALTGLTVVKTGLPNTYKPLTGVVVVKTNLLNLCKPSTSFVVVKMG